MAAPTPTPSANTISDADWRQLKERARKANPARDSFTDPAAIAARLLARRQRRLAEFS